MPQDTDDMERSKAIYISAIVVFGVSMVLFIIPLFTNFVDNFIFGAIATVLAIIAIIMIYVGTYFKLKENRAKEEANNKK